MPDIISSQQIQEIEKRVRVFLSRKVSNSSDRDDLVQTTVMEVLRDRKMLRDPSKLHAWALRIARNNLYNLRTKRKHLYWERLVDTVDASESREESELYAQLESVLKKLAMVDADDKQLIAVALQLCFDWTPPEIAEMTRSKLSTIYNRLRNGKNKLKSLRKRAFDPVRTGRFIHEVIAVLSHAATFSLDKDKFRDQSLLHQALWLAARSVKRYPNDYLFLYTSCAICCHLAVHSQYDSETKEGVDGDISKWNRDRMDRRMIDMAGGYHKALHAFSPPKEYEKNYQVMRVSADHFYYLIEPRSHEEVDWKKLSAIAKEMEMNGDHLAVATILSETESPLEAAKYLVKHKKVRGNFPAFEYCVGTYFYRAKDWKETATWYRKALKGQLSDGRKELVKTRLAECKMRRGMAPKLVK